MRTIIFGVGLILAITGLTGVILVSDPLNPMWTLETQITFVSLTPYLSIFYILFGFGVLLITLFSSRR